LHLAVLILIRNERTPWLAIAAINLSGGAACRESVSAAPGFDAGAEDAGADDATKGGVDAADARVSPRDANNSAYRACPDEAGTNAPPCDPSHEGQLCTLFEAYSICIEGQWLFCSNSCFSACSVDTPLGARGPQPDGSLCCPCSYIDPHTPPPILNTIDGTGSCCIGGTQATCENHRLTYGGPCGQLNAGLDGDAGLDGGD
jgi:hypothetical protein